MRGLHQILTTDDMGDPLMGVIHDARQMIGGIPLSPQNDLTNPILKFGKRHGFQRLIRK